MFLFIQFWLFSEECHSTTAHWTFRSIIKKNDIFFNFMQNSLIIVFFSVYYILCFINLRHFFFHFESFFRFFFIVFENDVTFFFYYGFGQLSLFFFCLFYSFLFFIHICVCIFFSGCNQFCRFHGWVFANCPANCVWGNFLFIDRKKNFADIKYLYFKNLKQKNNRSCFSMHLCSPQLLHLRWSLSLKSCSFSLLERDKLTF